MSNEQILEMVRQSQDLVNGSIISSDLNSILIGFCDLINHQNEEIEKLKLKNILKEKAEQEMENVKKEFEGKNAQIAQLQNQLAILANQTQSELVRSRQETETIKIQFNEQINASLRKISEIENSVQSQIRSLALQNTHSEEKNRRTVEELSKQNEKIDFDIHDLKIQLNTFLEEQKQSKLELPVVIEKPIPPPVEEKNESFDSSKIGEIMDQINLIEKKIEDNQNEISEVHLTSQKIINNIKNSEKKTQKLFDDETSLINKRIDSLEKQFNSVPEIQDLILSGKEIGLKPILQAVMRDSRRLDSFDQQVCSVRNECENVANGMVALSESVKQFNHQLFDFGIEVKSNSNKIITDIKSIKKFCKFLGNTVSNLISDVNRITEGHHHLTSTILLFGDEVSHLMTLVARRRLKTLNLFDDINLEASDLCGDLSQKKVDGNIEKQIQYLEGQDLEAINQEKLKNIQVPEFQKVNKPYKASKIIFNDDDEILGFQSNDMNPLVISSIEELRVKINDIGNILSTSNDSINTKFEDIHKEIKKKMDSDNIDRIILKIQNLLKRMQNEIEGIKSQKCSFSSVNQNLNAKKYSSMDMEKIRNAKTYQNDNNILINSASEARLVSSSAAFPLRPTQSSGIPRPSTAITASIMSNKPKRNYNENQTQRKSKNNDINNNIPIIQKASSGKLASSVLSNPKDYK